MQRLHIQELRGNEKEAREKAVFVWNKDEIAWCYCKIANTISKVKFTGGHWLVGNKWSYRKVYQFEIMSSSVVSNDKITHDEENAFFETLESAREYAIKHIHKLLEYETNKLKGNIENVLKYCAEESTYTKETLIEKSKENVE